MGDNSTYLIKFFDGRHVQLYFRGGSTYIEYFLRANVRSSKSLTSTHYPIVERISHACDESFKKFTVLGIAGPFWHYLFMGLDMFAKYS